MSSYPDYLQREQTESLDDYHIRLFDNKENYEIDNFTIANLLNKEAGTGYSESKWRKDYASFIRWREYFDSKKGAIAPSDINYKETVEISGDGAQKSDKLIYMSEEDKKDPDFLLESHGYDPVKWELTNSKSSIWNQHNRVDGTLTLYASKITVKPLVNGFDFKKLEELVTTKPTYKYEYNNTDVNINGDYLLLSLVDMHFGISSYEYYKETQDKVLKLLDKEYKEVLLVVGNDLFHSDSVYKSRTSNGTDLEEVDMVQAWEDARNFFIPIIQKSKKKKSKVTVMYTRGNHSETTEWAFVQHLKAIFPNLDYLDTLDDRKVHMLGKNFIGSYHGDKKNDKRIAENFATEFPMEWSRATTRTVFSGHLHHEMVLDAGGILIRRLPTKNKVDNFHLEKGYTTSHSRFQVHEFNETDQTGLFYL